MAIEEVYQHPDDYDLELAARDVGDTPFWRALLRRERPVTVLELGCGTGRLTIPLARDGARQGFHLVGMDPERSMLARAKQRLSREPAPVRAAASLLHGDARALQMPHVFDTILFPYGAAHHLLALEDQITVWRNARRQLRGGGLFCVDVAAPDLRALAAGLEGTPRTTDMDVTTAGGRRLRRTVASRYDPVAQCATHAYEYTSGGPGTADQSYRSQFEMHCYFPRELELLCRYTGFRVESWLGDYDWSPLVAGSPVILLLARAV